VGDAATFTARDIGSAWGGGRNPIAQTAAHAALGAGSAWLTGNDPAAGAIGGLTESVIDNTIGQALRDNKVELGQWGDLLYTTGAMAAAGWLAHSTGHDGAVAANVAQNAAQNNFLTSLQLAQVEKAFQDCKGDALCEVRVIESAQNLSREQDFALTSAKIACFFGSCERLDSINALIKQGNDLTLLQSYLGQQYPLADEQTLQSVSEFYLQGSKDSLENSAWRVGDSTLFFAGSVGALLGPLVAGGKQAGAAAKEGVQIASGAGGQTLPMTVERIIQHGESVPNLINEAKALTFATGNEHAIVTLANGQRALVSGGPGGISFSEGSITRIFGHTHPTNAPPSAADIKALQSLGQSKQYIYHGGEVTIVRPSP
jgi:hypothetical protein